MNDTLGAKFQWKLYQIQQFPYKEIVLKMSSKWRPFCLGINLLIYQSLCWYNLKSTIFYRNLENRMADFPTLAHLKPFNSIALAVNISLLFNYLDKPWIEFLKNVFQLIEAGLRELEEETGLVVTNDMCHEGHIPILAMWEVCCLKRLGL